MSRAITLDDQTAPPILVALRIASEVTATVGDREAAGRYRRVATDLTERWQTSPDDREALAAVDLLISGFTSDADARAYLTDLVRMLAVSAPETTARWTRELIESRARR